MTEASEKVTKKWPKESRKRKNVIGLLLPTSFCGALRSGWIFDLVWRILGKLPANFSANFDSEFCYKFFSRVFPGLQAPQKIYAQNSRTKLSAFLSNFTCLDPIFFQADFLLTGETNKYITCVFAEITSLGMLFAEMTGSIAHHSIRVAPLQNETFRVLLPPWFCQRSPAFWMPNLG